jgi:surface protein
MKSSSLNDEEINLPEGKKINEINLLYLLSSDEIRKNNYNQELSKYNSQKESNKIIEADYSKMTGMKSAYHYNDYDKPYFDISTERIHLFGNKFVEINFKKCKLIINNQEHNLVEYFTVKSREKTFQIKLIIKEQITNFDSMFKDCKNLLTCPDINNLDTSGAISFRSFFENCENLKILPKFLDWKTNLVIDMSSMFEGCKSLLYLPDLSKFDTSKVTDISNMFMNCSQIKFLPKINKWNTSKIKDMKNLFKGCILLTYIPDISIWDTSKVNNMKSFF